MQARCLRVTQKGRLDPVQVKQILNDRRRRRRTKLVHSTMSYQYILDIFTTDLLKPTEASAWFYRVFPSQIYV